jgi:hypothetical protein
MQHQIDAAAYIGFKPDPKNLTLIPGKGQTDQSISLKRPFTPKTESASPAVLHFTVFAFPLK